MHLVLVERFSLIVVAISAASFLLSACASIENPKVEPFVGSNPPPVVQELRWSNGKIPTNIDPIKAAAPPETDLVRALYDGLTELDSRSLRVVPAIAESWASSKNDTVWTFRLRGDAHWSNGERITAEDFVRSWKRLRGTGVTAAKTTLTSNLVGFHSPATENDAPDFLNEASANGMSSGLLNSTSLASSNSQHKESVEGSTSPTPRSSTSRFGVTAIDDRTLQIELQLPDKDLPALVADPIFRPVHTSFSADAPIADIVTSGPFKPESRADASLIVERSPTYWNVNSIALERIHFIQKPNSEEALRAYRNGEIDVITNALFEPGALKLLIPFEDFKRSTHAALNFYELNVNDAPLTDRRVREALSVAIDRERLADGDLQGTTKPATGLAPWSAAVADQLAFDPARGRELLTRAGFPNGDEFPVLRLAVNRNDTQQRVARAIRKMWQDNLGITIEIDVKNAEELNEIREKKQFDLIRRGTVFSVPNDVVNFTAVFESPVKKPTATPEPEKTDLPLIARPTTTPFLIMPSVTPSDRSMGDNSSTDVASIDMLSEDEALFEMTAIPLYFPISYALVKPYVLGFELNSIDAASLKETSIDTDWRQPTK